MCALTNGEQHTDNPFSTSARTVQPLSPEADPFVQGETLEDGSKGCRNDLEWRSRELAKQEADFEAEAQRSTKERFSFSNQNPDGSCVGHVSNEFYCFQYEELFSRQIGSFNMFEPFALIDMSKTQNLIGLNADWLNELI